MGVLHVAIIVIPQAGDKPVVERSAGRIRVFDRNFRRLRINVTREILTDIHIGGPGKAKLIVVVSDRNDEIRIPAPHHRPHMIDRKNLVGECLAKVSDHRKPDRPGPMGTVWARIFAPLTAIAAPVAPATRRKSRRFIKGREQVEWACWCGIGI